MRRVYEPRDLLEAHMLVGMLAAEGIMAFVTGQHLIGAVGELPAAGLLGVQVPEADAERARLLIAAYNGADPMPGDEPESYPGELIC